MYGILLLSLSFAVTQVTGLYTAIGGPCSTICNYPPNGTWWPDLVCADNDFSSTTKGNLLVSCLTCQSQSLYNNGSKYDQYWYMYHMKYLQQVCLAESTLPHAAADNCVADCKPLSTVLKTLWIGQDPYLPQYNYCSGDNNAYLTNAPNCSKCLQGTKGTVIVGNMVETMLNACTDKPLAANGDLVTTSRNLFNTTIIPLPTTSTTRSSSSTSASSTSTGSSSGVPSSSTTNSASPTGSLSSGAAAGIGVGVGLLAVIAIILLAFYLRRQRRIRHARDFSPPFIPGTGFPHMKDGYPYKELPPNSVRAEIHSSERIEADSRSIKQVGPPGLLVELPSQPHR